MKSLLLFFGLVAIFETRSAFAQPVWDPTEIARLSEQAAQLGASIVALNNNLQAFDKLASGIGALGARPMSALQPSATLVGKLNLQSVSMPSGSDAQALISNSTTTVSQTQSGRQIWNSAYQSVAAEGFSLAEVANQDLASAKTRSGTLGAAASSWPLMLSVFV